MNEWQTQITFNGTNHSLRTVLEYQSHQIMRIRVYGSRSSILLETNFPIVSLSKKAITWKLRDGELHADAKSAAALLSRIMAELEHFLKDNYIAE